MTLLLLCAFLQDGEIERLVLELSDESIEIRDRASADLASRGEPALPVLRSALGRDPDRELKSRIEVLIPMIAREARRAKFKGGDAVEGFQATLRTDKQSIRCGEELSFDAEIMNVSKETRAFIPIRHTDSTLPALSSSSSTAHARIVVKELTPKPAGRFGGRFGCGGRILKTAVELQSGDSSVYTFKLGAALEPGEYEIHVVYYAKSKGLLANAQDDLKSNVVKITVEK